MEITLRIQAAFLVVTVEAFDDTKTKEDLPNAQCRQNNDDCFFRLPRCGYTTSTRHGDKQSPTSTTENSLSPDVILSGARDWNCDQQEIGVSITTVLHHIPRTCLAKYQTFVVPQTPYAPNMAPWDF